MVKTKKYLMLSLAMLFILAFAINSISLNKTSASNQSLINGTYSRTFTSTGSANGMTLFKLDFLTTAEHIPYTDFSSETGLVEVNFHNSSYEEVNKQYIEKIKIRTNRTLTTIISDVSEVGSAFMWQFVLYGEENNYFFDIEIIFKCVDVVTFNNDFFVPENSSLEFSSNTIEIDENCIFKILDVNYDNVVTELYPYPISLDVPVVPEPTEPEPTEPEPTEPEPTEPDLDKIKDWLKTDTAFGLSIGTLFVGIIVLRLIFKR